jgi:GNAT superfamily N-acetyltransferase
MVRYEQDLRIPVPRPQARIPLTCRELGQEDLLDPLPFIEPERLPELRKRLRQGQVAIGAFNRDRLVAFTWLKLDEAYEETTGIRFPLKPGEIYSYHKLVDPAYRNLGVGGQLDWERNQIILAKGFDKKISFVDYRNYASHRSTAKAGSVPAGALLFIQVFGLRWTLNMPQPEAMVRPGPGSPSGNRA